MTLRPGSSPVSGAARRRFRSSGAEPARGTVSLPLGRKPALLLALWLLAGCAEPEARTPRRDARDGRRRADETGGTVHLDATGERPPADLRGLLERMDPSVRERAPAPSAPPAEAAPRPGEEARRTQRGPLYWNRERIEQAAARTDPEAVPELVKLVRDPISPHAPLAAWALGEIGGPQAERALREALTDERAVVRQAALQALVRLEAPETARLARVLLTKDRSPAVRASAAAGLGLLGATDAAPLLEDHLPREAPEVQLAGGWALAAMERESGYRILGMMAMSEDVNFAPRAIASLGLLHTGRSRMMLFRALFHPKPRMRRAAREVLLSLPERELLSALGALNPEDRRAVTERLALDEE